MKTITLATLLCGAAVVAQAETIGMSMTTFDDNYQTVMRIKVEEYVGSLDGVDIQIEDAQNDVARQLDQVNNFIASGVDAIMLTLVDTSSAPALTAAAEAAGIPLVYINLQPDNLDTRFAPGDAVFARPRDGRIGTLAELIAVDEGDLAHKPANLTMAEAAGLPLVALTAWQALVELAAVQPGAKVLIHAGSGGFGSVAIQLAKHLGAKVATTASSGNVEMVRALGADVVIDYRSQRFETVLSDYDLVVCGQDADTLTRSLAVLKPGGRLISISGPPTVAFAKAQGLNWVLQQVMRFLSLGIRRKARAKGIRYDFMFMRADGAQLAQLGALIEAGAIRPVMDRIFPFDQTNEAFAYLETGRAKGKVVVAFQPEG